MMSQPQVGGIDPETECSICGNAESPEDNLMIACDGDIESKTGCTIAVHQKCYHIPRIPPGEDPWVCYRCASPNFDKTKVVCCPVDDAKGAACWPTNEKNKFIHVACAAGNPAIYARTPPVILHRSRIMEDEKCAYCNRKSGFTVNCSDHMCNQSLHIQCGIAGGGIPRTSPYALTKNLLRCPIHSVLQQAEEAKARASKGKQRVSTPIATDEVQQSPSTPLKRKSRPSSAAPSSKEPYTPKRPRTHSQERRGPVPNTPEAPASAPAAQSSQVNSKRDRRSSLGRDDFRRDAKTVVFKTPKDLEEVPTPSKAKEKTADRHRKSASSKSKPTPTSARKTAPNRRSSMEVFEIDDDEEDDDDNDEEDDLSAFATQEPSYAAGPPRSPSPAPQIDLPKATPTKTKTSKHRSSTPPARAERTQSSSHSPPLFHPPTAERSSKGPERVQKTSLEKVIERLENDLKDERVRNMVLKSELEKVVERTKSIDEAEARRQNVVDEVLKKQYDKKSKELADVQQEMSDLRNELKKVQEQNDKHTSTIMALNDDENELKDQLEEMTEKVEELTASNEELRLKLRETSQNLIAKSEGQKPLERLYTTSSANLKKTQATLDDVRQTLDRFFGLVHIPSWPDMQRFGLDGVLCHLRNIMDDLDKTDPGRVSLKRVVQRVMYGVSGSSSSIPSSQSE